MGPFTLLPEQIVPRIVLGLPSQVVADIELSGKNAPVERHLVADLFITYAFDLPGSFKIAAKRDLERLGLEESQIHKLALKNLSERLRKLEPEFLEVDNKVFWLRTGGDFEATTLLFDHVWRQAAEMVGGTLVVSVPARDRVAFTSGENQEGFAFMRTQASKILERGDHALTRHFIVRSKSSWAVYHGHTE
jgi:uncharacterized protein YtpQ (UPF0354 family)